MTTIAFDLALNTTGVWVQTDDGEHGFTIRGLGPDHCDQQRHEFLLKRFIEVLEQYQPDTVLKEAIFVAPNRLNGSVQLITVHGLLTAANAATAGFGQREILEVSPTALKKWATGSGKASKDEMHEAAVAMGYEGDKQPDIVDAYLVSRFFSDQDGA
jgi:Holliday junction resolvasome RuvABC endonuclease subunit